MIQGTVKVLLPTGLHMRPAGILCTRASQYKSSMEFVRESETFNVKSALSLLGACLRCGDEIELVCTGPDEREAFDMVETLLKDVSICL